MCGGVHIDNCIHWLTGTKKGTEMYDVWKTTGALSDDTEYAKIDAFYTSTYKGKSVTLWNDLQRTEKELISKRFKELGGKICYNSAVEKIVVEGKNATGIWSSLIPGHRLHMKGIVMRITEAT